MAGRRPREPALPTGPRFGVDEGQEIAVGDEAWPRLVPLVGTVLECALVGSSIGLGVEDDEWFAGLIQEVQGNIMFAVAAAVSATAPLFVLILFFQRQIVSGLTAGAVKG